MKTKVISYGALSKEQLLDQFRRCSIQWNAFAEQLLFSTDCTVSHLNHSLLVTEITVEALGLKQGGTLEQIWQQARLAGLAECPLEAAFHCRFYYDDQPEEILLDEVKNQHPPGALVIYSKPISKDETVPKGLYLRKIKGELWIRGYRCSSDYVWSARDTFLFQVNASSLA